MNEENNLQNQNPTPQVYPPLNEQTAPEIQNPFVQTASPSVEPPIQSVPEEPEVQNKKNKDNSNDMFLTSAFAKVIGTIICLIIFVIVLVLIAKKFFVLH